VILQGARPVFQLESADVEATRVRVQAAGEGVAMLPNVGAKLVFTDVLLISSASASGGAPILLRFVDASATLERVWIEGAIRAIELRGGDSIVRDLVIRARGTSEFAAIDLGSSCRAPSTCDDAPRESEASVQAERVHVVARGLLGLKISVGTATVSDLRVEEASDAMVVETGSRVLLARAALLGSSASGLTVFQGGSRAIFEASDVEISDTALGTPQRCERAGVGLCLIAQTDFGLVPLRGRIERLRVVRSAGVGLALGGEGFELVDASFEDGAVGWVSSVPEIDLRDALSGVRFRGNVTLHAP
jgi:hypothetical protein